MLSSTTAANISPLLDRKIEEISAGISASYSLHLRSAGQHNVTVIIDYIVTMKSEVNLSDHYRRDLIEVLSKFSKYNDNKSFKDLKRSDVIAFLETFRRTETQDPLHKWIGTYNIYRIHLIRFFKWLYNPDIEPDKRPKPALIENIPQLKRKEKSIYKPSDLWTQQDDLLFLKFCTSKRDKCYHAISRDTSCRPHEIVKLKIRDIVFKTVGSNQYAEALVNGKTGSRPIPPIDSIPYLKDYLDHEHPQPSNPNSPLICGTGRGLGRHVKATRIYNIYNEYKKEIFPKLLESPTVLPEDKKQIAELLKKPWNPYIRRHSALTEKARILKEPILKMHAGWTPRSQMHLIYEHRFGDESNESLLEAYGIVASGQQIDQLRPKQCPNCSEPNKPDSKFCNKCRMIMSYDAYAETLEEQKKKESEVQMLKDKYKQDMKSMREEIKEDMKKQISQLVTKLKPEIVKEGLR
ncbi:tyrosine-type recombinase/integrase [soil metagenome]